MSEKKYSKGKRLRLKFSEGLKSATRGPKQLYRRFFGSVSFLSDLYYFFFDRSFSREHRAVLRGIAAYEQLEQDSAANSFMLRRNTHRLEKGLLMRPRRDLFALKYINETMSVYERCLRSSCAEEDSSELIWAHDVLAEYFKVTGSDPLLDTLRARFSELPDVSSDSPGGQPASPYLRDLEGPLPVEYEAFFKLSKRRRSVRWFKPEPVPRDLIDKALTAAIEAPSACNRQPFQFHIFDEPELVKKISTLPMGTKGYAQNIPTIVVVVGHLHAYFHPRDRHLIYIDSSLAAMGFMYALETLGLSSCPINWPDIPSRERKMAKTLGLAPDQRPIMLIAVGYPDPEGAVAFSQKHSLDSIRTYNS